jgi:hypothetical protein
MFPGIDLMQAAADDRREQCTAICTLGCLFYADSKLDDCRDLSTMKLPSLEHRLILRDIQIYFFIERVTL